MEIKLKTNSWHFKLYTLVASDTPPRSLCPYFWSLVGIIITSPLILIAYGFVKLSDKISEGVKWLQHQEYIKRKPKPKKTVEELLEKWRRDEEASAKRVILLAKIGKVLLITLVVSIITLMLIFMKEDSWIEFFIALGASFVIILSIVGAVAIFDWFNLGEKFEKFTPLKWLKESSGYQLVIGIIVATYTKLCPIIQWQGNLEEKDA